MLKLQENNLIRIMHRFIAFMLSGLPGFFAAIFLNVFFVEYFKLNASVTYFFVLVIQTIINFLFCGKYGFNKKGKDFVRVNVFFKFASAVIVFRILNWLTYCFMVKFLSIYYIAAQIINVILFSILKYSALKKVYKAENDPDAAFA